MHVSAKPVHKCHGCKLNLGTRCAVFPSPHEQWKRGRCKGYNDEALYQKYLADVEKHPANARREKRKEHARLANTEPHHDGTLSYVTPVAQRTRTRR